MRKLFVVLSLLAAGAVSAQQYKWVDQDGRVRYGDTPPPGVKATPLRPPTGPSSPPPPSSSAAKKGEKPLTPEQAFQKRQQEAAKDADKRAQAEGEAQAKRENCERAQEALRSLESGQRIQRTNAQGERYYLEDAQIQQEAARARVAVQQSCS